MDKIISGQSFLYRKNGYSSTIIEIKMKDKIRGDYLQVALSNTLKRFPYLSYKLVEKQGSYYLEEDTNSMTVNATNKARKLGSMQTGYHLLDITYLKNSVYVAFHHGLCDGRGIKPFIETLIYYYCTLKYKTNFDTNGIHLMGEKIDKEETEEPFGKELYEVDESKLIKIDKDCFHIPENTEDISNSYRTEFIVNEEDFMKKVKEYSATPAILTAELFSKDIYENNKIDKKIMCNMAVDLRSIIAKDKTHKNAMGTICLSYAEEEYKLSLNELSQKYRKMIAEQKDENFVKAFFNKQIAMFGKLNEIKSLEEKRKLLSFFDNITNDTYVISYLGKMRFNDFDKYVDSCHLYSEGSRGIIINMISAGGNFTFNILQNFDNNKYIDTFEKMLKDLNVRYIRNNIGVFNTGKDKSYITASHQAERYYK